MTMANNNSHKDTAPTLAPAPVEAPLTLQMSAPSQASSQNNDSTSSIEASLLMLRDCIIKNQSSSSSSCLSEQQQRDNAKVATSTTVSTKIKQLVQMYEPSDITKYLAHRLFIVDTNNDNVNTKKMTTMDEKLSNRDALILIGEIIKYNSGLFLKLASKSIRNEAIRLVSSPPTTMSILEEFPKEAIAGVVHDGNNNDTTMLDVDRNDDGENESEITTTTIPIEQELTNVLVLYMSSPLVDAETSTNATEAIVACCQRYGGSVSIPSRGNSSIAIGSGSQQEQQQQQQQQHVGYSSYTRTVFDCIRQQWTIAIDRVLAAVASPINNSKLSYNDASNVIVRCASTVIDILVNVHAPDDIVMDDAIESGVMDLFVQVLDMEKRSDDPLLIMSLLDLLESFINSTKSASSNGDKSTTKLSTIEWLLSNDVVVPVLEMAGGLNHDDVDTVCEPDPILGGPALRVVAALSTLGLQDRKVYQSSTTSRLRTNEETKQQSYLDTDDLNIVDGFYRALHNFVETSSTMRMPEIDRLAVIDAISSLVASSPNALHLILSDPVTKTAWLNFSNIAQPRLKSAVLISIAHVLYPPAPLAPSSIMHQVNSTPRDRPKRILSDSDCMELLVAAGDVNGRDNTSSGIYGIVFQLSRSSILEIRLGCYSLMEAMCTIPMACQVLLNQPNFYDEFLIVSSSSSTRRRDSTKEGREGMYSILCAVYNNKPIRDMLADNIVQQIHQSIERGPHYMAPIQWDVSTMDG